MLLFRFIVNISNDVFHSSDWRAGCNRSKNRNFFSRFPAPFLSAWRTQRAVFVAPFDQIAFFNQSVDFFMGGGGGFDLQIAANFPNGGRNAIEFHLGFDVLQNFLFPFA